MSISHGAETTISVATLAAGDWIESVPAQSGYRGVRVQSAVQWIMEDMNDTWTKGNGRGRRRTVVDSAIIQTRRGSLTLPLDFTVTVRRAVTA